MPHERLRLALIRWNVAPLTLVGVMVFCMIWMLRFYMNAPCELPEWHVAGLFTFIGGIAGIIYKMYDSMQRNRSEQ